MHNSDRTKFCDADSVVDVTYHYEKQDYFDYKMNKVSKQTSKPARPRLPFEAERSLHYGILRLADRTPDFLLNVLDVPMNEEGIPILSDRTRVRVELTPETLKWFAQKRYEIIFFVDGLFYAEEGQGYSPYTWLWTTKKIKPGVHLLTVNVASLTDQIGCESIFVLKP